ncbi:MAG TPA: hypothetical protein VLH56_10890 [Dissulfurispiraceae bacterium]|nr:hypothetical protein [Dissulfurispiraceae bacterium]
MGDGTAAQPDPRDGDGDVHGVSGRRLTEEDYRIAKGELEREGSWRETAARNLDIIELVHRLEAENRQPTAEEKALLVKYVGWGASVIRNGIFYTFSTYGELYPQYADPAYRDLVVRAKEIMTPEEIRSAAQSSQYAHYTSESIIRSIYNALERFGFPGGKILEPGMGIGHFWGLAPDSIARGSTYTGVERDAITAKIAKLLYPNQSVSQAPCHQPL